VLRTAAGPTQLQLRLPTSPSGDKIKGQSQTSALDVRLGLGQVHHAAALFPETPLFKQVNALETFENVALGGNGTGGTKAAMLGHKGGLGLKGKLIQAESPGSTSRNIGLPP